MCRRQWGAQEGQVSCTRATKHKGLGRGLRSLQPPSQDGGPSRPASRLCRGQEHAINILFRFSSFEKHLSLCLFSA